MDREKQLAPLIEKAEKDKDILAVILFGSYVQGERHRDIDVCLVLDSQRAGKISLPRKSLEYIKKFDLDIHLYQELPIYIQIRVLKEGEVILCRDEDALYDQAIRTSRLFEDYLPRYREYLERVADAKG